MSSKEMIGRLQGLLERVQMRAGEPRANGHAAAAAAAYAAPEPHAYPEPEPLEAAPITPMAASQHETSPPPAQHQTAPPPADDYDVDAYGEVEVSSEVVEVDIDVDEPMALESGAQPIAQPTMPPEDLEDEADEAPMTTKPSDAPQELEEVVELTAGTPAPAPALANEIEEPAPSSSRRPIAGEEAAAGAYEEESAPRHTPPPESGKQVAAAPSNHPPSRKPSAPPPSLEGHTLIGGWREPGLGGPQIGLNPGGMPGGVRVPAPPAAGPGGTEPPATVAQGTRPAMASGTRLTPDVTRGDLADSAEVAAFQGSAPVAKPRTLGELLDLTLGL